MTCSSAALSQRVAYARLYSKPEKSPNELGQEGKNGSVYDTCTIKAAVVCFWSFWSFAESIT